MSGASPLVEVPPEVLPEVPPAVPPVSAIAVHNPIPDAIAMGHRFLPDAPTSRIVTRLHALLIAIDASWDLEAQLDWLEQLSDWLHRRGWRRSRRTSANLLADHDPRTLNLQLLVTVLNNVPPWRVAFSGLMRAVLSQMQATQLFSDVGLPQEPGFCVATWPRLGITHTCAEWSRFRGLDEACGHPHRGATYPWITRG